MKFTDGYWQIRPGVEPIYAVHLHDVEISDEALTVYAATRRITHRGDTLNSALLTMRYSSPMENVIRVQIDHHQGVLPKKPDFRLNEGSPFPIEIEHSPNAASLTSGELSVVEKKSQDWNVR